MGHANDQLLMTPFNGKKLTVLIVRNLPEIVTEEGGSL
jgi:hypothetical protein